MARLKLKVSGASLIEVIVSSIIILVSFTMAMDILTKLSTTKTDVLDALQMEMDTRSTILNNQIEVGIKIYDWGEIEVFKRVLKNNLIRVSYEVRSSKNGVKKKFDKIIKDNIKGNDYY